MNITITDIPGTKNNGTSFGMASFTPKGLQFAQSCSDVYACLGEPTKFRNPDFYKPVGIFGSHFAKYVKTNSDSPTEIAGTIRSCGATNNGHINAVFIKQLLSAGKNIDKMEEKSRIEVKKAVEDVFAKNWNNPEVSKKETLALLDMTKEILQESSYATLIGVIEKSNMK